MLEMRRGWVGLLMALPFVWAMAGFAALQSPPTVDHPSTVVVAQFLAERSL